MHLGKKGLVLSHAVHTWNLKLATLVQFHIVKHILLSSSETFKCKLIQYISKKMIENALSTITSHQLVVVIDSPAVQHPVMVTNSTLYSYPQNKHGEADYAIWHHAFCTPASSVLVVSCDTDSWVYGLGIYEVGYLGEKTVYVHGGTQENL